MLDHLPFVLTCQSKRVASQNKHYFQAANGTKLSNLGCKDIQAWTENDDPTKMRMQVGEGTKRFLGSVLKSTNANCRVIFDNDIQTGGQIIHKEAGQIIPIHKQQSNHVMHLWPDQQNMLPPQEILTGHATYILDNQQTKQSTNTQQEDADDQLLQSTFARLRAR